MKYIRTKDGIYEVIELHTITNEKGSFISDYFCKGFRTVLAENVIDIANTIEELCDEFVFITNDEEINKRDCVKLKKHIFMRGQKGLSFSITERDQKENGYYGAIWTEWGLKYVAKMNEKGELELL